MVSYISIPAVFLTAKNAFLDAIYIQQSLVQIRTCPFCWLSICVCDVDVLRYDILAYL